MWPALSNAICGPRRVDQAPTSVIFHNLGPLACCSASNTDLNFNSCPPSKMMHYSARLLNKQKNGEGFFETTAVETSFSGRLICPTKRSAHFRKIVRTASAPSHDDFIKKNERKSDETESLAIGPAIVWFSGRLDVYNCLHSITSRCSPASELQWPRGTTARG